MNTAKYIIERCSEIIGISSKVQYLTEYSLHVLLNNKKSVAIKEGDVILLFSPSGKQQNLDILNTKICDINSWLLYEANS